MTQTGYPISPLSLRAALLHNNLDDLLQYRRAENRWAKPSPEPGGFTGISPANALALIWERGRCAGEIDTFDPENDRTSEAKAICALCPVRESCLDYAVSTRQQGVWGGTTDSERTQIRRAS